jgi:hypothetical protein
MQPNTPWRPEDQNPCLFLRVLLNVQYVFFSVRLVVYSAVRCRSSVDLYSLTSREVYCGQIWSLSRWWRGQDCRKCCGVWSASPHWLRAEGFTPILFRCALRLQLVSNSQTEGGCLQKAWQVAEGIFKWIMSSSFIAEVGCLFLFWLLGRKGGKKVGLLRCPL